MGRREAPHAFLDLTSTHLAPQLDRHEAIAFLMCK